MHRNHIHWHTKYMTYIKRQMKNKTATKRKKENEIIKLENRTKQCVTCLFVDDSVKIFLLSVIFGQNSTHRTRMMMMMVVMMMFYFSYTQTTNDSRFLSTCAAIKSVQFHLMRIYLNDLVLHQETSFFVGFFHFFYVVLLLLYSSRSSFCFFENFLIFNVFDGLML